MRSVWWIFSCVSAKIIVTFCMVCGYGVSYVQYTVPHVYCTAFIQFEAFHATEQENNKHYDNIMTVGIENSGPKINNQQFYRVCPMNCTRIGPGRFSKGTIQACLCSVICCLKTDGVTYRVDKVAEVVLQGVARGKPHLISFLLTSSQFSASTMLPFSLYPSLEFARATSVITRSNGI